MFVFVVMAITATVANGACPDADDEGVVDCFNQSLATIPISLSRGVTTL